MKNMNANLTESAAALLIKLADMTEAVNGEIIPKFTCTEVLTKKENGVMTGLKKKGLLSTELLKGGNGDKALQVTLTPAGLDAIRELTAADEPDAEEPEPVAEPAATGNVAAEAGDAPEADAPAAEGGAEVPGGLDDGEENAPEVDAPSPGRVNTGVQAMFDPLPESGTILTKLYKGSCYQATLKADGSCILNDGSWFSSLTAAARFITGAKNISGRKFFGIPGKRVASK